MSLIVDFSAACESVTTRALPIVTGIRPEVNR